MPRLPPLPLPAKWAHHFPASSLAHPPKVNNLRKAPHRLLLASPTLCDQFVRTLGIRPGEVIIEGYAGPGALTRSLVSGGRSVEEGKAWEREQGLEGMKAVGSKGSTARKLADHYPIWKDDLPATSKLKEPTGEPTLKPKLVMSTESSYEILRRGLDYPLPAASPQLQAEGYLGYNVAPSKHQDNLLLSHATLYSWEAVPALLSNPLVRPHLPVWDPSAAEEDQTKRPWNAPTPHITVVLQVPDGMLGEQITTQWIRSAVGDNQKRAWMWKWGRVRLALLCGRTVYDRLTTTALERMNSKMSVMTRALFHVTPLPPYHHIRNIDKRNTAKSDVPIKPVKEPKSTATPVGIPEDIPPAEGYPEATFGAERTETYTADFFPGAYTSSKAVLPRTPLFGVLLTPKLNSPISMHRRDAWDFVLRRMFVRESCTVEESIGNLAFGADSLLPLIEQDEGMGIPVSRTRVVKQLDVEEWARIVEVFDTWGFRPESLLMDNSIEDEVSRQIGLD
ncbi:hypothetical protein B9479_001182 [Cryptococcus floricola]|uniref:Mitochondrial transcription factor 1 n=1 Tax=Cryptococcus floricola TaxID=2591691 RepID=A0A5D3B705_9TREE|nr:hypothetical protein B9479_001182 [Cryptococcus floricola]